MKTIINFALSMLTKINTKTIDDTIQNAQKVVSSLDTVGGKSGWDKLKEASEIVQQHLSDKVPEKLISTLSTIATLLVMVARIYVLTKK
jgi:hypothetical protein